MFRWIVVICLVLIAYGVLYHDLPCRAQLLDKTVYCQLEEAAEKDAEKERQFAKTHHGKTRFEVDLENLFKQPGRKERKKPSAELETPSEALPTLTKATAALPEAPLGTVPPVLIHQVDAEYSEEALAARREGKVILDVDVDPTGHVVNPHVVRTLGVGLDEKAIEAVRQWRYRPARKNGQPISFPMQIEFNFRLGKN